MADPDSADDWLSAATEPEPEPVPVETPKLEAKKKTTAAEEKKAVGPPTEVTGGPKKRINHHWARPIFLQYDYLYNYYHNYYDDIIEYLDRRLRGFEDEKPRPQTWAERALRTYTRNYYPLSTTYSYTSERRSDRLRRQWLQQSHFTCFKR